MYKMNCSDNILNSAEVKERKGMNKRKGKVYHITSFTLSYEVGENTECLVDMQAMQVYSVGLRYVLVPGTNNHWPLTTGGAYRLPRTRPAQTT